MKRLEDAAAIPSEDKEILRQVRQAIRSWLPDATLYLYGSGAWGTREPDSDLDLLILTPQRLFREAESIVTDAIYELELANGVVISTVFYSQEEWDTPLLRATPFRARVDAEAVLV